MLKRLADLVCFAAGFVLLICCLYEMVHARFIQEPLSGGEHADKIMQQCITGRIPADRRGMHSAAGAALTHMPHAEQIAHGHGAKKINRNPPAGARRLWQR